jgi:SNF2 family DNA or RNA helicase
MGNNKYKLYPYQREGVKWILNHIKNKRSCLLADDMGLGKTLQIITVISYLKNRNNKKNKPNILIIVPVTLMKNWEQEFNKFAPTISIFCYDKKNRNQLPDVDVILISYSLIVRDIAIIKEMKWFLVILDEAHNIKNYESVKFRAIFSLQTECKIVMTGTPLINNVNDLYSLFTFLYPGILGDAKSFITHFMMPIEYDRDPNALRILQQLIQPFILRRLKSDILKLPKKVITNKYCILNTFQKTLYDNMPTPIKPLLKKAVRQNNIKNPLKLPLRDKVNQSLKLVIYAKQLCNHPQQVKYNDKIATLYQESSKTEELIKIIKYHKNEKGLIFTQIVKHHILIKLLEHENINALFLHGKCTIEQRNEIIKEFSNPLSKVNVLIISLFTGGTGLNLTIATYVVHFDLWWNSALEDQATDRAYRIGQTKIVNVYRLITKNTWEEEIFQIISRKRKLINIIFNNKNNIKYPILSTKKMKDILYNFIQHRIDLSKKDVLKQIIHK